MCRFTAYLGPEIPIERIVVLPAHSLLDQSQNATEAKLSVNGDGFGIAWYNREGQLGQYRDVLPAWSDGNLPSLCKMIRSGLFMAHVRASTTGETSRVNCHPFVHGKWSFMHNGQIGDFARVRRQLEATLPDNLYHTRRGNTDSELLFLLLLANGLENNPLEAARRTIALVTEAQGKLTLPNRITCAFSDGTDIYGFRSSSDNFSPTLYVGNDLDSGGCVLASEPLDETVDRWTAVPEGGFIRLGSIDTDVVPLAA